MHSVGYGFRNEFKHTLDELEQSLYNPRINGPQNDLNDRIQLAYETATINELELGSDFDSCLARIQRMQRLLQAPVGNQPAQRNIAPLRNIEVQEVRDTFYNLMAELAEQVKDLNKIGLEVALSASTLVEAMHRSRNCDGILCTSGNVLTLANCPGEFTELAQGLLACKEYVNNLSAQQFASLKSSFFAENPDDHFSPQDKKAVQPLATKVHFIAQRITERAEFKEIIRSVLQFCTESRHGAAPYVRALDSVEPSPESLLGVTEELVRTSFYETMAEHALCTNIISQESLVDQEPYIYFALSQHAIIQAILLSRDLRGAIALVENKALTLANCPETYRELAQFIFKIKPAICQLTDDQIRLLKLISVEDSDIEIPEELLELRTKELMGLAAHIGKVASQISQRDTFKQIIQRVIAFILPDHNDEFAGEPAAKASKN